MYVKQPEGYVSKTYPSHVLKLTKSLYGLKQAPLEWFKDISEKLIDYGLVASFHDPCLFQNDGIIVVVYVDDVLISTDTKSHAEHFYKHLQKSYSLKELEEANYLLGISIKKLPNGDVQLHQKAYINKMLEDFHMDKAKYSSTPVQVGIKYQKEEGELPKVPYRELVGSLMYLMLSTRPDIAYAVSMLSRFLNCYSNEHWIAAKQVLRYLAGTQDVALHYSADSCPSHTITAFTDTDWGGDVNTRKSTEGYCIMVNQCTISWRSALQKSIALSSAEAEYMGLSQSIKEILWIKGLLQDLKEDDGAQLLCDNQSAIHIASNPSDGKGRTKHVDIRYHFCKNAIANGEVSVDYVPTKSNAADIFTKALGKQAFLHLRTLLGISALREAIVIPTSHSHTEVLSTALSTAQKLPLFEDKDLCRSRDHLIGQLTDSADPSTIKGAKQAN